MACRDISFLSGIISLFEYRESSPEAKLVHAFKYSYALESAPIWLKIFKRQKEAFAILGDLGQNFTIIPVPLYSRRERERGFNQSKILAEILFEFLRLNFTNKNIKLNFDSLRRSRPTDQQVKLVKEEREKNVFNAFVWRGGYCDENVVLVDDVFTTGATMQECARVLKQAGAKSVWGVTLARSLSL